MRLRPARLGCGVVAAARPPRRAIPRMARVFLQMPLGVNRRADALVVAGLERVDDPRIEMHFVGGLLRAHSAPFALRLEPLSERLRDLAHRSTPERSSVPARNREIRLCTRRA